ncbi:MAG: hypothetical protein EXS37_19875 [Opitutus sp.]|nr:hypothetical protein [Opitutus sp.]
MKLARIFRSKTSRREGRKIFQTAETGVPLRAMPPRFLLVGAKTCFGGGALKKQLLLGSWLRAGWSVSEKFSYPQNIPTQYSGTWGQNLPHDRSFRPVDPTAFSDQKPPD